MRFNTTVADKFGKGGLARLSQTRFTTGEKVMKKVIAVAAVALAVTLVGSAEPVQAGHCSSSFGGSNAYSSFGFRPSYSSFSNRSSGYSRGYSTFGRPSYGGFGYSRPGFSISIGSGRTSFGFGRSYGRGHSHGRSRFGSHRH